LMAAPAVDHRAAAARRRRRFFSIGRAVYRRAGASPVFFRAAPGGGYAVIHSRSTASICASLSSPLSAISLICRVMALSSDSPKVIPISRAR